MLAATLQPAQFAEVSTPDWAMETKWDGHRVVILTGPDGTASFNREGVRSDGLPVGVARLFEDLETPGIFDGELAKGRLYLFDLAAYDGEVSANTPWARRNMALRRVLDRWSPPGDLIELVTFVRDPAAKIALLAELQETGGEGVVFKRITSKYEHGEKSGAWRKLKFLSEVDAIVTGAGHEGKNNLTLGLADPTGPDVLPGGVRGREVGRCSALTGDGPNVKIGDVVTVTVTGLGATGRLVEPVTPRLRTDKPVVDCTIDQLHELRRISR